MPDYWSYLEDVVKKEEEEEEEKIKFCKQR